MTRTFKRGFLLIAGSLFCFALAAQPKFDGGMMVHTGYLAATLPAKNHEASGMPFGIGGTMRFHVGSLLRVGGEGFITTLSLMDNGSYVRIGWGGVVAELRWRLGCWHPFFGCTLGGGSATTLLMFDGSTGDWDAEPDVVMHSESFMLADPHIGLEYALTEGIHLTSRLSYLTPLKSVDVPTGPRVFLGFVFAH